MASSPIVDIGDNVIQNNMGSLPEMMFAAGEEPVGVRIIDIGDKPSFSGRFARYMMSRQLKVKKKHEVWFRFAGQPIRFSLREFAIVTGLPCGTFPPKSKMKIKETITEKPYWPSLFGKVEVVTVASVIKMLHRRTVRDRETRIKFACLAILSSVLLPTSLNMKISREHAEAIEDLDDFYSFPWGRLAYEMLMNSIKERDEISLSQNTIAVKGFALALQLVLVEAVPSLTEVVQETCSSSESESADDVEEGSERSSKKQTLSPAHARNLDKKTEVVVYVALQVYVKSIIDEDPSRPLDESTLGWSDDVEDVGVDNLVKLINEGYKFSASMFKGGATKADVERMREDAKVRGKEKKSRKAPVKPTGVDGGNCEVAAVLMDMIKPDLDRIDGNVSSTMRAVDDMITKIGVWHGAIKTEVGEWMGKIKEDIQGQISLALKEAVGPSTHPPGVPIVTPTAPINPVGGGSVEEAFYRDTIRNIMGSIEQYRTPPRQNIQVQEVGVVDGRQDVGAEASVPIVPDNDGTALLASSHTHMRKDVVDEIKVTDNATKEQAPATPSFSLGLTQQEISPCNEQFGTVRLAADLNVAHDEGKEDVEANNVCRKSKRQKIFPTNLMADYECGHNIVGPGRQAPVLLFVSSNSEDTLTKYQQLGEKLLTSFVINVAGLSVSDKDIKDIAERSRPLTAKIVDLLTRILRTVQDKHLISERSTRDEFFDTKFAGSLARNYSKFAKCKNKEGHVFPKGTLDFLYNTKDSICMIRRFYLPFNFDKKHWVGVCIDCEKWKIYVLDCNTSIKSDKDIVKDLTPIAEAFPYLLKQACGSAYEENLDPMVIERVKGVGQNKEESVSGITAMLLIWNHSIGGLEGCRSVNADHVILEAKGAAVMAYELHEELK
ncbi:hypothetical protein HID58_025291 [Brassica napus]|uniref:Ubiquitin-like protease family profile domain-containing protein n=1 Tax=Brassica napus TaxID=3708 RepID=A0ABQ8CMS1_BRANA|nr:hypothetical protein HID58_025291 [Brassica napus]